VQHFVEATRRAVSAQNWYAALATALTMPDICGRLESPQSKSQDRFVGWYERYLLNKYQMPVGPERKLHTFLSGSDCYALRCAFLHQGEFEIDEQRARDVLARFHFTAPRPGMFVHMNIASGNTLQLQVDRFCLDVCDSVDRWLGDVGESAEIQQRLDLLGAVW
jgi:hypothetical protein